MTKEKNYSIKKFSTFSEYLDYQAGGGSGMYICPVSFNELEVQRKEAEDKVIEGVQCYAYGNDEETMWFNRTFDIATDAVYRRVKEVESQETYVVTVESGTMKIAWGTSLLYRDETLDEDGKKAYATSESIFFFDREFTEDGTYFVVANVEGFFSVNTCVVVENGVLDMGFLSDIFSSPAKPVDSSGTTFMCTLFDEQSIYQFNEALEEGVDYYNKKATLSGRDITVDVRWDPNASSNDKYKEPHVSICTEGKTVQYNKRSITVEYLKGGNPAIVVTSGGNIIASLPSGTVTDIIRVPDMTYLFYGNCLRVFGAFDKNGNELEWSGDEEGGVFDKKTAKIIIGTVR